MSLGFCSELSVKRCYLLIQALMEKDQIQPQEKILIVIKYIQHKMYHFSHF